MTPNQINIITNIIALLLAILEPVRAYFSTTQEFNWTTFLACVGTAVIGWFTSKSVLAGKK